MEPEVRKMRPEDWDSAAKIHIQAFPDQFASRMGRKYVAQMYRFYSEFPTGVALIAVNPENGDVCGIRAGAGQCLLPLFRKKVAVSFLPRIAFKCLTDSLVFKTFWNALGRKIGSIFFKRPPLQGIEGGIETAGVVFISQIIAVEQNYRGDLATALALIEESAKIAKEMGYKKVRGQVYLNNPRALAFDKALGFKELFREGGYCVIEKNL